jgi:hypothetical protein
MIIPPIEPRSQGAARSKQVYARRYLRDIERFRNFAMAEPLEIVQQEDLPLQLGQAGHFFQQPFAQQRTFGVPPRITARGDRKLVQRQRRTARARTPQIQRSITNNFQEPGGEPIGVGAVIEAFESDHETILCHILSIIGITRDTQRNSVRRPEVAPHQLFEGRAIATPG